MANKDLLERRALSMGSSPIFYKEPVHLVKGFRGHLADMTIQIINTWIAK